MSRGSLGICIDKRGLFYLEMEIRSREDRELFLKRCRKVAGQDAEPVILTPFQVCFEECLYHCYLPYDECRSECARFCLDTLMGVIVVEA